MNETEYQGSSVLTSILNGLERDEEAMQVTAKPEVDTPPEVVLEPQEEDVEIDEDFSFEGFEVVRREFFAHMFEPSISLSDNKIGFNTACMKKWPNVEYVQFLINPKTKTLAISPCEENDADSFLWCTTSKGKRKPRQVSGKLFFVKMVELMGWNTNYRYKILGKYIKSNGKYLFVFDLNATETYKIESTEGTKKKISRVPIFPQEWQNQFGVPYEEHQSALKINIFDGYAVYAIQDKKAPHNKPTVTAETVQPSEAAELPAVVSVSEEGGSSYAG